MKKTAKLILLLVLVGVVLTGCSTSRATSKATNPLYAMLRMPDGSIIQGVCDNFNISYGCVRLEINGTVYVTGLENVVLWRGGDDRT